MKKILTILLILICSFYCVPNVQAKEPVVQKTMFEIRDVQTHYFETTDTQKVWQAVISTLQDNGFIIEKIEGDLGFLKAKKDVKLKRTQKGRVAIYSTSFALNATCFGLCFGLDPWSGMNMVQDGIRIKNEIAPHTVIIDSNVFIDKIGNRTKVRFSVIEKVLENADGYTTVKSSPRKVVRHYEPEIYQEFFSQVDKSLFLEQTL